MCRRNISDWEAIEKVYRAGQLSANQIAKQFEVAPSSITRRAKREGWERDLSEQVRQKTRNDMLRQAHGIDKKPGPGTADPKELIETAAAANVIVLRQHVASLGTGRDLVDRMMDELFASTTHVGELEEMIEEETAGDKNPRERQSMLRAVSLPQRAGVLRDLSAALQRLINSERQALNLDGQRDDVDEFSQFYAAVKAGSGQRISESIREGARDASADTAA
jgi:hypothetical protein